MTLAVIRRKLVSPPSGLLDAPNRPAGINYPHPGSRVLRFSGVSGGANFIALSKGGAVGSVTGSPAAAMNQTLGLATSFGGGTSDYFSFTGQPTTNDTTTTMAAIYTRTASPVVAEYIFNSSASANGIAIGLSLQAGGSHNLDIAFRGNTNSTSSITLALNTPYFLIGVADSGNSQTRFLVKNLLTGVVTTATGSNAVSTATLGTAVVGGNSTSATSCAGQLAAVMFSATALSLAEMVAWAADPWSFWYPR